MTQWMRIRTGTTDSFAVLDGDDLHIHDGTPWANPTPTGAILRRDSVEILPVVAPGKFIGLWNNFHEMAAKLGTNIPSFPLYFLKATSSLLAHDGVIRPPASYAGRTVYEGELGIVIGRTVSNVSEAEAEAAIFGYTCVNDVTAIGFFEGDPAFAEWARAKGCDTFGPVGPVIATGLDWQTLRIRTLLNGRERQNYPASDMILPPARIVSLISQEMTLYPGDLIACGTSVGVMPMRAGMTVEVVIDGIGTLRNTVEGSQPA